MTHPAHSCWDCGWRKEDPPTSSEEVDLINPPTLFGVCWGWLPEQGKPMEIQATKTKTGYVCDKGCKKWTDVKADFEELKKTLPKKEETPTEEALW